MTPGAALAALATHADAERATKMSAYHKAARPLLGVPGDAIEALTRDWRRTLPLDERLTLAQGLWLNGTFEARLAAAKLLTQARVRPDDAAVWETLQAWVPEFDGWAIADTACNAIGRRLSADLSRLDIVERWTTSEHLWTKRAALVSTLPLARLRHPNEAEQAARARVLGWAAKSIEDREWFIQKAIAWWLRELSRKDPNQTWDFLGNHGAAMAPFARKDAARLLTEP